MRTKCKACNGDAAREWERRQARIAAVHAWREARGKPRVHINNGWRASPEAHEVEVCRRVAPGAPAMWWEREPGYVAGEIRAALRRAPVDNGLTAKRDRRGNYKPINYTLPLPTLAASEKRLSTAVLDDEDGERFTGRNAAVEWIAKRRVELGLDNSFAVEVAA